jgi:hypothetical protein
MPDEQRPPDHLPAVIAHADWSLNAKKRWVARAVHEGGGHYRVFAPEPVGTLSQFFGSLKKSAKRSGALFVGFDFPLGLPRAYARRAGIDNFRSFLSALDRNPWRQFFCVAEHPGDISPTRPFYPAKAGKRGTVARHHLLQGLGLDSYQDLLRVCDRASPARPAACAIFWTLGPQQVGKAAIVGWRDLLIPALVGRQDLTLWPFDGELDALLARHDIVAAETYPAEVYGHLGLWPGGGRRPGAGRRRESKRLQAARAGSGSRLLEVAGGLGLRLEPSLREAIADGFGPSPDGEDPFDATVGLLGMVNVALGRRSPGTPCDPEIRRIEGWILGQEATI